MLAFAALVPHPLISIPEIGNNNTKKLKKTATAFLHLQQELYASKPDTIIIISPHTPVISEAFSINQRPRVRLEFSSFGDLIDEHILSNDIGLGYRIKESMETDIAIALTEEENLDYGFSVPLWHLLQSYQPPLPRVIPLGYSTQDLQHHFEFGQKINNVISVQPERIAVLASGDLSHGAGARTSKDFAAESKSFNDKIRTAIENNDIQRLLQISDYELNQVSECGLRSLLILLGVLDHRNYSSQVLSYEAPFGVGYLMAMYHWR